MKQVPGWSPPTRSKMHCLEPSRSPCRSSFIDAVVSLPPSTVFFARVQSLRPFFLSTPGSELMPPPSLFLSSATQTLRMFFFIDESLLLRRARARRLPLRLPSTFSSYSFLPDRLFFFFRSFPLPFPRVSSFVARKPLHRLAALNLSHFFPFPSRITPMTQRLILAFPHATLFSAFFQPASNSWVIRPWLTISRSRCLSDDGSCGSSSLLVLSPQELPPLLPRYSRA